MRRIVPILAVVVCAWCLTAAGQVKWFGGAGLTTGWAENPTFDAAAASSTAGSLPCASNASGFPFGLDPNSILPDPNSILPDPNQPSDPNNPPPPPPPPCSAAAIASGTQAKGYRTGSLTIAAGLNASWEASRFDATYTPSFYFYEASNLNEMGHGLSAGWEHRYTPRNTLNLKETAEYTPEQVVSDAVARNELLVRRTRRTLSDFEADYEFRPTSRATVTWTYGHLLRAFADDLYVDSSNHNAGLKFSGRIGERSFVTVGYEYGIFAFADGFDPADPNATAPADTRRQQAAIGYRYSSVPASDADGGSTGPPREEIPVAPGRPYREPRHGTSLGVELGYHLLQTAGGARQERGAPYVNGSFAWYGTHLAGMLSYLRGLTDGGGAFANAESQTAAASLRFRFSPEWFAEVVGQGNLHERVEFTGSGPASDVAVRTAVGRVSLGYALTEQWSTSASYSRYWQRIEGDTAALPGFSNVPELSSGRYEMGVSWTSR